MYSETVNVMQAIYHTTYHTTDFTPLHEPRFFGNEKKHVNEAIDSTVVSRVDQLEKKFAELTGAKYAVAKVNGTSAAHIALKLVYVDRNLLGLSPTTLKEWLSESAKIDNGICINKNKTMTRLTWQLINHLPVFSDCNTGNLDNPCWLKGRWVNIPGSLILE